MVKIGNFEIEYNPNAAGKLSVKIEPGEDGSIWLTKVDIAQAYGVLIPSVTAGLKSLAKSEDFNELVHVRVEHFLYQGKQYSADLYSLETVIALGFRMKGLKCSLFRKWVAMRLAESFQHKDKAVFFYMPGGCGGGIS